jgi:hypothetical protein
MFTDANRAVACADDVTLFEEPWPTTPLPDGLVGGTTLLGVSPLSVDEQGATHYVYSKAFSVLQTSPSTTALVEITFTGTCAYLKR